ncbi:hypothetical protein AVEN_115254-1 [Araneus ventricosus]|uniref:Uncharacterized protein n=1 Tax=Araneus ventricosus TaxID=182803 RepID=A0A4Y1ZYE2_ARAVE|nr:hypothetical protein AVEN_115254-1 [Araneus ventricosus]
MTYFHSQPVPHLTVYTRILDQESSPFHLLTISRNPFLSLSPPPVYSCQNRSHLDNISNSSPKASYLGNRLVYQYPIADYSVPFQRRMDRLPSVSDTKVQVNLSGTNQYQYQHVSDTATPCINPSLANSRQLGLKDGMCWIPVRLFQAIVLRKSILSIVLVDSSENPILSTWQQWTG